jgi:NAD(P)-dependent dehydrogenase (short-subunit alcohol dehydrogenase family)
MKHRILEDRNAVVYGGGGAVGGAIARAFAQQGARVFLAGRTPAKLEAVARDIGRDGGAAETDQVDAQDERAVEKHADGVAAKAGSIDISVNAIGIPHVQGPPLAELSLEDFALPITGYTRTNFITAKAAARHMTKRGSGVILTISTPGSRMVGTGYLGYGVTCAAVEAFSRLLAADLGPSGIRVLCLQPHAIPEAAAMGSHSARVFRPVAERAGTTVEEMLAGAAGATLLKRLPTLEDVGHVAAFLASDLAAAMTGTVANLTCGALVD